MNQRKIGTFYEREAVKYLQDQGVRILEMNYQSRQGEIDIIGYDNTCLVFFEVKARNSTRFGFAAEAVGSVKQKKICRTADYYRMRHHISGFEEIRYDCIVIEQGNITWIKNAFEHRY